MFEAVILAGGFGTRLKEISEGLPKPMVKVGKEPFLYRLMKDLESNGCSKIILSLHFRSEYIIERVQSDLPVKCMVEFVVEDVPLGTGGAIKNAAKNISSSKFVSINGDTYSDIDYMNIYKISRSEDVTISAIVVEDSSRYGSLDVNSNGEVVAFNEKHGTGPGLINSGTYVLPTNKILNFDLEKFSIEKDFFPCFDGIIKVFKTDGLFIDIGVPKDYLYACKVLG